MEFQAPIFVFLVMVSALTNSINCAEDQKYSFIHDATSSPAISYYDYIIIGGGPAGCAMAATLSNGATALLLERGGSPYGNPSISNLKFFMNNLFNMTPSSPSQHFVSTDGVYNIRARILGGGSAINAGFYSRASEGYVTWSGWKPDEVEESYRWVEGKVAFEPEVIPWQKGVKDGLLEVGMGPDNGFTYEHNAGAKIGGTIFDKDGHRHTAADLLEYADTERITVYLHATVQKILFNHAKTGPRGNGVVYKDKTGVLHNAMLKEGGENEIVVCAGAIGSPQMLMLSGIGGRDELGRNGIDVVLDNPLVGQRMADNPMNALYVPSSQPVDISLIQTAGIPDSDGYYVEACSALSVGLMNPRAASIMPEAVHEFYRKYDEENNTEVEGRRSPFQGGLILEKVSGPRSYGNLTLISSDPDVTPLVTFNYFKDPEDLKNCVEGMNTVLNVIQSRSFSKYRDERVSVEGLLGMILSLPVNLRPRNIGSIVSLEQYCKDTVTTIWHYHGGCHVGAVVDGEYRVLGVGGVRVVDGSTFGASPGTNPQATVMMLGRYVGAKMIKARNEMF